MENKKLIDEIQKIEKEILDDVINICEEANIPYFLDGGTLLGAKRHKGFIPWDDDIDIAIHKDDWNDFESLVINKLSDKYIIQSNRGSVKIDTLRPPLKVNYRHSYIFDVNTDAYKNFPVQDQNIFLDVFRFSEIPESEKITSIVWLLLKWSALIKEVRPLKFIELSCEMLGKAWMKYIIFLIYPILLIMFKIVNLFETPILDYYYFKAKNSNYVGFDVAYWRNNKPSKFPKECIYPLKSKSIQFGDRYYSAPNDVDAYLKLRYGDYMKCPPEKDRVFKHLLYIDFEDEEVEV